MIKFLFLWQKLYIFMIKFLAFNKIFIFCKTFIFQFYHFLIKLLSLDKTLISYSFVAPWIGSSKTFEAISFITFSIASMTNETQDHFNLLWGGILIQTFKPHPSQQITQPQ
jgi:hypothetical protein